MCARRPCVPDMKEIREELERRMGPLPAESALVGFSGGADSTALLILLLPLREKGLRLEAVHVNHGLRGRESEEDQAFAEAFCREREIPLHAFRLNLGERRDEDAARQARYECFRDCVKKTGIPHLVLAHQMEDQAETFLMRLLRGAGPEGLGCMRPREEREGYVIYRPLLKISGGELRQALTAGGIPWREDGSNAGDDYFRNRIRHSLLPEMERLSPGAGARIARTAELIGAENEASLARTDRVLESFSGEGWLLLRGLEGLSGAESRRVLRRWWQKQGPERAERNLDYRQTLALSGLIHGRPGERVNLPGDWRGERGRSFLHLIPPDPKKREPVPFRWPETAFGGIRLLAGPSRGNPGDGRISQEVPRDFPAGCQIRTRRTGDWIRPFGMDGRRSLQDYLTDRKIDAPFRDRIPLLCRGNEVLLAAGVGAGGIPPWREEAENVRLEWKGHLPWAGEREA